MAGVAAGAALGGLKLLGDLPGMLKGLRDASGQAEGGPFDRIIASAEKFQQIGTQLLATVFSPLAPAFELAAQYAGQFFDRIQPIAAALGGRLGGVVMTLVDVGGALFDTYLKGLEAWWPLIDKVAQAFEAAVFVVGELAVGALDLIGQLYDWLGGLIGKAVDFGTQGKSGSQLFFDGAEAGRARRRLGVGCVQVRRGNRGRGGRQDHRRAQGGGEGVRRDHGHRLGAAAGDGRAPT